MTKNPDFQKVLDEFRTQIPLQAFRSVAQFHGKRLGKGNDEACVAELRKEFELYIRQYGRVLPFGIKKMLPAKAMRDWSASTGTA